MEIWKKYDRPDDLQKLLENLYIYRKNNNLCVKSSELLSLDPQKQIEFIEYYRRVEFYFKFIFFI